MMKDQIAAKARELFNRVLAWNIGNLNADTLIEEFAAFGQSMMLRADVRIFKERAEKAEFELAEWKDRWFSTRPIIQERDDLKSDLAEARKRLGEAEVVIGWARKHPVCEHENHHEVECINYEMRKEIVRFLAQQEAPKP